MVSQLTMKVVEESRVGPAADSVAESTLSLTFFDVIWLKLPPVQRLFFYELSDTDHFINSVYPNLKVSLSQALETFYPLAGTLNLSPETSEHVIHYTPGDSVKLTLAEANDFEHSDFDSLVSDQPRRVSLFHPLVPDLPNSDLISLQLTVFPNSGVCLGIAAHHVAADGSGIMHFMRSWSSICRAGAQPTSPIFDRALIPDPDGLKRIFLAHLRPPKEEGQHNPTADKLKLDLKDFRARPDSVRATFVVTQAQIESMKKRVLNARGLHASSFVVTFALVGICLVKAKAEAAEAEAEAKIKKGQAKVSGELRDRGGFHLGFAVDCRTRLDPEVPKNYFGNCISMCLTSIKGKVMEMEMGMDGGFVGTCEAIVKEMKRLDEGVLKGAEGWFPRLGSILASGDMLLSVAGSPRLRVYDTDYGFGRPIKVEVVSIEDTGAISIAETRDGSPGLEFGVVLTTTEMESFANFFHKALQHI